MRYLFILITVLGVAWAAGNALPTSAEDVSADQLEDASWVCLDVAGAIHCAPPGPSGGDLQTLLDRLFGGEAEELTFLVFSNTDGQFLGTEHIIRRDLFHDQPCPTDAPGEGGDFERPPSGEYTDLLERLGIPYFACHTYDSPF